MSKFRKAITGIVVVEILLIVLSNIIVFKSLKNDDTLCMVEAKQIARRLENEPVSSINTNDYETIIKIEPYDSKQVNYE